MSRFERRKAEPSDKSQKHSPFIKYCVVAAGCILLLSIGFVTLVFKTDALIAVINNFSAVQQVSDFNRLTASTVTEEIKQEQASADLDNIDPPLAGLGTQSTAQSGYSPPTGTFEEQVNNLKQTSPYAAYYGQTLHYSNGYYYEKQRSTYNALVAGSSSSNTVGHVGCYIYALCQIRSYITGSIFTTVDWALENPTGNITCAANGVLSGTAGTNAVGKGNDHNIEVKAGVSVGPSLQPADMQPGKYYVVYGNGSSDAHWRAMVTDGTNVTVLPNVLDANPVTFNPTTDQANYNHYFKHNNGAWGGIFEVTVN